ncbi:dynamin family protein [Intrasporangium flavum]|uniref:dynamin family protein n=1 Tax=Intrasporangium flavum TaxID=1428657 RepID=UPI00096D04EE|nr:dynamin family protein [Intrasporangium flavum]
MSPIRMGRAQGARVTAAELATRTTALSRAILSGGEQLDPAESERARRVVDRAVERSGIGADHTVVALAGATGSGKSSLFNALVGSEVATIGARRPTTSKPTAAVWGDADATRLLDWLGVKARHGVGAPDQPSAPEALGDKAPDASTRPGAKAAEAAEAADDAEAADASGDSTDASATAAVPAVAGVIGSLDGLVLLDLPDFDSREQAHRDEAERVLGLVDVFVWVTDPQKYADARLHDEFVAHLSHHDAVTLGVLNQVDRLPKDATATLTADLAKLLEADGVTRPAVLATSTVTGQGVPELAQRIANVVAGHAAARQRLSADVVAAATSLRRGVADHEPDVGRLPRTDLDASLARAAGVPIVLDAVERDHRRRAFGHTAWLYARWGRALTPDPIRRLRLDRAGARPIPVEIGGDDVRAALGRSSIPAPTTAAVSAVDLATRGFVREAATDLPVRWATAVEDSVQQGEEGLADALDRAMVDTPLQDRRRAWWFVVDALQWVLGLAALGGLLWYAVLWVMGLLALPRPEVPTLWVLPLPLVLLLGGVVLGLVLGALSRAWAQVGARRRRRAVAGRLTDAVGAVADDRVLVPVDQVLARHRDTREHLEAATR